MFFINLIKVKSDRKSSLPKSSFKLATNIDTLANLIFINPFLIGCCSFDLCQIWSAFNFTSVRIIFHQSNFPQFPLLRQPFPLSQECKAGELLHRLESLPPGSSSQPSLFFTSSCAPIFQPSSKLLPSSKTWRYEEEEEEPPVSKSAGSLPSRRLLPSHRLQSAREGRRASSSSRGCEQQLAKPNHSDQRLHKWLTRGWGEEKL